jgi:hypothetical protein
MEDYILPAGKYLIGDPCYFFSDKPHEDWLNFLEQNDFLDNEGKGVLTGTDLSVVVFGTKYGDGLYKDEYNNEYGVDSGLIGIIPYTEESDIPSLMHLIQFDKDFECINNNGYLHFGDIVIDTVQDYHYDYTDETEDEGVWDEP